MVPDAPVCALRQVTKSYGTHTVLEGLDLAVERGETLGITGPSGVGKSTVLNLLGMLERPDAGDVVVCGVRNPSLGSRRGRNLLRTKVAYLFQNYALVDDATVEANLAVPLISQRGDRRDRRRRMIDALENVGLDKDLAQPVSTLSGGEQQRLAFARLLLRPTELILADEPTGSLDPDNRDAILALLDQRHRTGVAIVIATHDRAVLAICQRSIALDREDRGERTLHSESGTNWGRSGGHRG